MRFVVAVICVLVAVARVEAHPEGFSGLRVSVGAAELTAVLSLQTRDLSPWFPAGKYPNYVVDVCAEMRAHPRDALELDLDGQALTPTEVQCRSPETGIIELKVKYAVSLSGSTELLVWSKGLARMPRGHQQLLFIEDVRVTPVVSLLQDTLGADHDSAAAELPTRLAASSTQPSSAPGAAVAARPQISFFALGVEHIVTGYDHLLFLAALLLVCRSFREAAGVITFFTIAHSITLTLAALDIVRLPARIVEPAIAASIVYVGLENIFGRHRVLWRAMVTFGFGLVHGLGFASALREVGLGSTSVGVAAPLLKFSIGLETGQLCIAAVLLRILLTLRKMPAYQKNWIPAGSVIVSAIGGYWLVTRLIAG